MKDEELKAKIINRLFKQYQSQNETYLHSHFIHHDTKSPEKIIPIVNKLINPKNVVDVGCGLGAWLKVYQDLGINDVLGIDGLYTKNRNLMVSEDNMVFFDLEKLGAETPDIDKKFDLAISLEVAEHLKPEVAHKFIELLTTLSDAVLFSAAIPYQGGINHVNEQWVEYWQAIFDDYGYEFYDLIRPEIWNDKSIKWWYKQNTYLVVKKGSYTLPKSREIHNMIHPEFFMQYRMLETTSDESK